MEKKQDLRSFNEMMSAIESEQPVTTNQEGNLVAYSFKMSPIAGKNCDICQSDHSIHTPAGFASVFVISTEGEYVLAGPNVAHICAACRNDQGIMLNYMGKVMGVITDGD